MSPKLPPVPLDEALAEQAFVNIIQNAYDAMNTNGGVLTVTAERSRRNERNGNSVDGVEVRIADSGPGISPELQEQIFNPFVTTKKTGVGLGLSIVSKIIDGHHGSIRIENSAKTAEPGRGPRSMLCDIFPGRDGGEPADGQCSSGDLVKLAYLRIDL